jgi:hypothetical protein
MATQIGVHDGCTRLENGKNRITRWLKGKNKKNICFYSFYQPLENHYAAKNQKSAFDIAYAEANRIAAELATITQPN